MNDTKSTEENEIEKEAVEGRREALKKLGSYAFAAPVMMSVLVSKKASAISKPPGTP